MHPEQDHRLHWYSEPILHISCNFNEFNKKIVELLEMASYLDYQGYRYTRSFNRLSILRHFFDLTTSSGNICTFYKQIHDLEEILDTSRSSPVVAIAFDSVNRINLINCPHSVYRKFERQLKNQYEMGVNHFTQISEHSYQVRRV